MFTKWKKSLWQQCWLIDFIDSLKTELQILCKFNKIKKNRDNLYHLLFTPHILVYPIKINNFGDHSIHHLHVCQLVDSDSFFFICLNVCVYLTIYDLQLRIRDIFVVVLFLFWAKYGWTTFLWWWLRMPLQQKSCQSNLQTHV